MRFIGTVPLETERLLLRRYQMSDAEVLYEEIGSKPEVTRYISWNPCDSLKGAREFVTLNMEQYKRDQSFFGWAITMDGVLLGSIGVYNMDPQNESCELGYNLRPDYQNRGITTETVKRVVDFLFRTVGMHKICASVHEENEASKKVLKKAGFSYEATAKEAIKEKDGSYKNLEYFCILQSV